MPVCRDEFWEFRPNEANSTWWFTGVLILAALMTARVSTSGTKCPQEHETSIVHWVSPHFCVFLPPYPGCDWFPQMMSRYHHQSWHQDVRHVVALMSKSWDVNMMVNNQGFISLISISLLFGWINVSMQCNAMDHNKESVWKMIYIYRVFSKGWIEVGPPKSLIFWTFPGVLGFFWPFNMGDFSF